MVLVADSGSTKTEWVSDGLSFTTQGINPVRDSREDILDTLRTGLLPQLCPEALNSGNSETLKQIRIWFYGAGCINPYSKSVTDALKEVFPEAEIHVYSDLLGAARALCGRNEGIACILGTGSNSCLCRDGEIVSNVSPLGFILGDEGSGAVLGKTLLGEILKGNLTDLWESFYEYSGLGVSDIINKVYRESQPNRFLASLVPFVKEHLDNPEMERMVIDEFCRFLKRNVEHYGRKDLSVNFVGGIASEFQIQLAKACHICDMKMGNVLQLPAKGMLEFHTK